MAPLLSKVGRRHRNCRCCDPRKPEHGRLRTREKRQFVREEWQQADPTGMWSGAANPPSYYFATEAEYIPFGYWFAAVDEEPESTDFSWKHQTIPWVPPR